jgi:hypothetical protein
MAAILTIIVATLALAWLTRALIVRWRAKSGRPAGAAPIRTLVVMGSGGHTAEMLALLGGLDRRKYAPLLYAFAASDHTSPRRVAAFEEERAEADGLPQPPGYQMLRIPRSREVCCTHALPARPFTYPCTGHGVQPYHPCRGEMHFRAILRPPAAPSMCACPNHRVQPFYLLQHGAAQTCRHHACSQSLA